MEEITIDLEKIATMPDNSITDAETIRQIALHAIQTNDNELLCKIKKEFQVAGLYPHLMKTVNMDFEKFTADELKTRSEILGVLVDMRERQTKLKKNEDGSVLKYQHAAQDDVKKYIDMAKELKNFAVRNQDYEGASAVRNIETNLNKVLIDIKK